MIRAHCLQILVGSFLGVLAAVLGLSPPSLAVAATWRVPDQVSTIADAVAAAAEGDTVLVGCGTYSEHGIDVPGGIVLRSTTGEPDCVTVDGGGRGRLFDVQDQLAPVVFEGLTLTGGVVVEGWLEAMGGAIRSQNASVRLLDCVLEGNGARIGAGLGLYRSQAEVDSCVFRFNASTDEVWAGAGAIWVFESAGTVTDSHFEGNTAFSTNPDDPGDGGAILCNASDLVVADCVFVGNSTGGGGGAFYSLTFDRSDLDRCVFQANEAEWGGAFYFESDSRATLDDCTFTANTARYGGALLIDRWCTPILQDCEFVGNTATFSDGGAVQMWIARPVLRRCRFEGNETVSRGGAIFVGQSDPLLEECVFVDNLAGTEGGALFLRFSAVDLLRSTLVGNAAPVGSQIHAIEGSVLEVERSILAFGVGGTGLDMDVQSTVTLGCSDLFGNEGGDWTPRIVAQLGWNGNISEDPRFIDRPGGDLRVRCVSSCSSANAGDCGGMGALGDDCPPPEPTTVTGDLPLRPSADLRIAPNPFNPATVVTLELARAADTRIEVVDTRGRPLRRLASGTRSAGRHVLRWDGRDDRGRAVASGIYFVRVVQASATIAVAKAVLIR